MPGNLARTFSEMDAVLGICPCCGEIFRLSETNPHVNQRKPVSQFDLLAKEEEKLDAAEARLQEREAALREKARAEGQRQAKRRLRKIDPVFSARGLDPQDVKVVFDPVEYVVFDGLNADKLRGVLLMAEPPASKAEEAVHASIESSVRKGNVDFKTLRVGDDGAVTLG